MVSDIILWYFLFWNRYKVVGIYTSDEMVKNLTNYTIWITIIVIVQCFMKNSILGVIKALE